MASVKRAPRRFRASTTQNHMSERQKRVRKMALAGRLMRYWYSPGRLAHGICVGLLSQKLWILSGERSGGRPGVSPAGRPSRGSPSGGSPSGGSPVGRLSGGMPSGAVSVTAAASSGKGESVAMATSVSVALVEVGLGVSMSAILVTMPTYGCGIVF